VPWCRRYKNAQDRGGSKAFPRTASRSFWLATRPSRSPPYNTPPQPHALWICVVSRETIIASSLFFIKLLFARRNGTSRVFRSLRSARQAARSPLKGFGSPSPTYYLSTLHSSLFTIISAASCTSLPCSSFVKAFYISS